MKTTNSRRLQKAFNELIPGGAHTYAKGDDQYPEPFPVYIERGAGSHVWDVDGNEFIEYGMGLRSVTLGHAHPRVLRAAYAQMEKGANFVRPAPVELDCAQLLHELIPCAEMVKFGKHGSDVTSAAVKLARAHTGRDLVGICSDHPFFSVDDWFIGSTPMDSGIPEALSRLTLTFRYNDLESVQRLFSEHPGQIACLVLEPEKSEPPRDGFLDKLQVLCRAEGAVLVFDEMITGFRWHLGGGQAFHGVTPDLATFGKGIANGFSVSALVGRREIMKLGGFGHDQARVFLLSTTHGAETHALAAAMETIAIFREQDVVAELWKKGQQLERALAQVVREMGLENYFELQGRPCCLVYATRDRDRNPSQPFRTLFLQETMKRGLLAPSLVVSHAHSAEDLDRTVHAIAGALDVYRRALEEGIEKHLVGRPVKPVFRPFA